MYIYVKPNKINMGYQYDIQSCSAAENTPDAECSQLGNNISLPTVQDKNTAVHRSVFMLCTCMINKWTGVQNIKRQTSAEKKSANENELQRIMYTCSTSS